MTIRYLYEIDPGYTLLDRPLWWHLQGLTETASGYGRKLTSSKVVQLSDGRVRRVYITCFSNAGSAWVTVNGERFYLRSCD